MSDGFSTLSEFTPKSKSSGEGGGVRFVTGALCQSECVQFQPVGRTYKFSSVFDTAMKRSRRPQPGEKASLKFLTYGLKPDGSLQVYVIGSMIVQGIKEVFEIRESTNLCVEITATGSGMTTEYTVRPAKGVKAIDPATIKFDDNELPKIAQSLLGPVPAAKPMTPYVGDALDPIESLVQSAIEEANKAQKKAA